jgi:hypothetical protein
MVQKEFVEIRPDFGFIIQKLTACYKAATWLSASPVHRAT